MTKKILEDIHILNWFSDLKGNLGRAEMGSISIHFWRILVIYLCWAAMAAEEEYQKYKDPKQPMNVRINDLMSRMTLAEKIGQMTQIDRTVASGEVINKYLLGNWTSVSSYLFFSFGFFFFSKMAAPQIQSRCDLDPTGPLRTMTRGPSHIS